MTAKIKHSVTNLGFLLLMLFVGAVNTHAEDFENLTLTDANGAALTSSFSYGYGLSSGWKIVNGTIYPYAGTTNYGLVNATKKGHDESNYYLEASYGKTNTAYVFIPEQITGTVKFWAKSNLTSQSKNSSSVKIYEADADGNVTNTVLYSATPTKGGKAWVEHTVENAEGKYIAINLVYTDLDDFTYGDGGNGGGGDNPPVFVEKKALKALSLERVSDYEITANKENKYEMLFNVKVQNSGNVTLNTDEISVSITNSNGAILGTATATDSLKVDSTVIIPVTVTADAGQGGYFAFYAKENLTNTYVKNEAGNNTAVNAHITAYYATFAILDPNGVKLMSNEEIVYGTSNTAMTKSVTIKNEGTAPLKVSSITLPEGFTTPEDSFYVAAGSEKTVDITMAVSEPYGVKQGNVTIEHALGTFTFAVKGTSIDPSIYFESFESNTLPESWTIGEKWTITTQSGNHYVQQTSLTDTTAIITQRLTVNEGEVMTVDAKRAYATSAATLVVSYSMNKSYWTEAGRFELTSAFVTDTLKNIPAGDVYLKFEGRYVAIDNLAGFHISSNAPMLTVYDAKGETLADSTAHDLGTITADALTSFIIKNTGTGSLNVKIQTEGAITANKQQVTLAAEMSDSIKVTMPVEPFGQKEGVLIITGEEKEVKVMMTAYSRDPKILFVDFQDQAWPKGWTADEKWNISHESYSSTDYYAEHYDYTGKASNLITQKLKVTEGAAMTFKAKRASEVNDSKLTVYTSTDRKEWTPANDYTEQLTTDWTSFELSNITAGEYFLRFEAANVDIDNIEGFEPVADYHIVTMDATLPDSAIINWEYEAKAVVKNLWADSEEVTVKFYLAGEEKVSEKYTLGYGETKTLAYAFTPHAEAQNVEAWFEITYGEQVSKSDVKTFNIVAESDETNAKIITGTVVCADDDTWPLAGVSIVLKATDKDVIYETVSDEKGQFSIKIFRSDLQYTLTATKEGMDEYTQTIVYVNDGNEYTIRMTDIQTAIKPLTSNLNPQTTTCFDLQGRQTTKAKGIVIINGKKYNKK